MERALPQYHHLEQGSSQVKQLFGRNSLETEIPGLTILDFRVVVQYFETLGHGRSERVNPL
jgi:hypothetical protein